MKAEIQCIMGQGEEKAGENCAGNIVNESQCKVYNVVFEYKYCNFNPMEGTDLKFDRSQTFHSLNDVKLTQLDRTVLTPTEKCRTKRETSTINSCGSETVAELQLRGNLPQSELVCESNALLRIIVAKM